MADINIIPSIRSFQHGLKMTRNEIDIYTKLRKVCKFCATDLTDFRVNENICEKYHIEKCPKKKSVSFARNRVNVRVIRMKILPRN